MNKNHMIKLSDKEIKVTSEDIDDIVCTALEGGITYWCNGARIPEGETYLGEYASDQISRGGTLLLSIYDEEEKKSLTYENFLNGLKMYIESSHSTDIVDYDGSTAYVEPCYIDADIADSIIQYAVFGDIIYG